MAAAHSPSSTFADRFYRARRRARLAVLRHRRPIAAALAGLTVWSVLTALSPHSPRTVGLLVAARDLPAGSRLANSDVVRTRVPQEAVPDDVARNPVGEVLAAPVTRGEPLTRVRLLGPDLADGHPGAVAVPVRLPDPGMAALLHVGDVVDLVASGAEGGPGSGDARVIAARVPVLALPPAPSASGVSAPGDLTSGRLVVVAVPSARAAAVSGAAVRGYVTYVWSVH